MAGQLKEVRNRIKSVQNTQQITKAMKMVSAAKLRKAQDGIVQMRPYAQKLQEVLSNIVSASDGEMGMGLASERPVENVILIVITSDRGLCGAYNANIIKMAKLAIAEKYAAQAGKGNVQIWTIGKKGYEHFLKNKYNVDARFKDIFLHLNFESVQAASKAAREAFESKQVDRVDLVYSEFRNAATQKFTVERFLPIPKIVPKPGAKKSDFIFEPSREVLVARADAEDTQHTIV